jgi:hypothetical protein
MYNSLEVASKAYIKNENEKIFLKLFVFAVYFYFIDLELYLSS